VENSIFLFPLIVAALHFMAKLLGETIYEDIAAQIGLTAKARSKSEKFICLVSSEISSDVFIDSIK
jgi:hypothetical protein